MSAGRGAQGAIDFAEELGTLFAGPIEGAALYEAFQRFLIGLLGVDPGTKLFEGLEGAIFFALLDGGGHGGFADILDRSETITDGADMNAIPSDRERDRLIRGIGHSVGQVFKPAGLLLPGRRFKLIDLPGFDHRFLAPRFLGRCLRAGGL